MTLVFLVLCLAAVWWIFRPATGSLGEPTSEARERA